MDEGITAVDDVLPVKFMHNGNEIGRIVNDKFFPTKFQFEGTVINEVKLPGQNFGKDLVKASDGTIGFRYQYRERFMYRAMPQDEYIDFVIDGISGNGEKFVSPSRAYCQSLIDQYPDQYKELVKFTLSDETIDLLAREGVQSSDLSPLVSINGFDNLPSAVTGWANDGKVYFKQESRDGITTMNISLQSQYGKDIFNNNTLIWEKLN